MLTARAAGTEGIDAQILGVQRYVHLFGLRHDRHRGGGGVDAALGLGLGHALHPVHPALILEAVVGARPIHREHGFFHTAQFGLIQVQQLQRPAVVLGVHGVHPQKAVGKQGGFLAACTAPDLHDDAFAVVDVPGEQQNFEIFFQLCHILTFFADFLLYHLFEVRIGSGFFQQGPGLRQVILRGLQCPVGLHHRLGSLRNSAGSLAVSGWVSRTESSSNRRHTASIWEMISIAKSSFPNPDAGPGTKLCRV